MDLIDVTFATSETARIIELERRAQGSMPTGDFEGSVTGYWLKLDNVGIGLVEFKGKTYKTTPIGLLSIPKGTEVELTFAKGVYYSKF